MLTRGYKYELQPPIPVEVLEGRVRGKLKKPIEDYVEDPSHDYPDGNPDDSPVPEELQEKPELEGEAAQEEAGTKVDPSLKTDQKPANTKEAPDKTAKPPSTKNPTE